MILVLSPEKEVTKSISKETVTLSVVIPNIRGRGRNKKMTKGFGDDKVTEVKVCWS